MANDLNARLYDHGDLTLQRAADKRVEGHDCHMAKAGYRVAPSKDAIPGQYTNDQRSAAQQREMSDDDVLAGYCKAAGMEWDAALHWLGSLANVWLKCLDTMDVKATIGRTGMCFACITVYVLLGFICM